jgi:hypothetical protein
VDAYWQFYTLVRGQRDLLGRTEYVARGEWPVPTEGAVLVAAVPRAGGTAAFDHPDWAVAAAVPDLDGSPSLVLLRAKASP